MWNYVYYPGKDVDFMDLKINLEETVKLYVLCLFLSAGSEQREEFVGAELVSLRLQALTKEERLLLSPNLEPSALNVLASPHGLVLVAVAGTIHRDGVCLGIFEQIFGLISSPLENGSWKIKFVNLKIRGQDALEGNKVAAPSLSYSSAELQLLCSWTESLFTFFKGLRTLFFTWVIQHVLRLDLAKGTDSH